MPENVAIFSFFGPPGAGKGTLSERCKKDLGFNVLSTGALCRKHVALGTPLGLTLDGILKAGHLIPDEVICEMTKDYLLDTVKHKAPIILDGFPRTSRQARYFLHMLKSEFPAATFRVIFFKISDNEIIRRLSNRLVCSNQDCQFVYSLISLSPRREGVCDRCSSPLIRRNDDSVAVIKERLAQYPLYEKDLLDFYKSVGQEVTFLTIDSLDASSVFDSFKKLHTTTNTQKTMCESL